MSEQAWDIEVFVEDAELDEEKRRKGVKSFTTCIGSLEDAKRRADELAVFPFAQMGGRVTKIIKPRPTP